MTKQEAIEVIVWARSAVAAGDCGVVRSEVWRVGFLQRAYRRYGEPMHLSLLHSAVERLGELRDKSITEVTVPGTAGNGINGIKGVDVGPRLL